MSPGPAFGFGQMSRDLARILRVDAEGRLQRERSRQTPSVFFCLFISSEDLALAFTRPLGHTSVSKRTLGLQPGAERCIRDPLCPLPASRLSPCQPTLLSKHLG